VLPHESLEWILGRTPEEIALALRQSVACVLPLPDGASFRRTTFIAVLSPRIPIITTRGKSTPGQLVDGVNVLFADNATAIANGIDQLLTDTSLAFTIVENSKKLSSSFSWEQIASDHIKAYERLKSC